MENTLSWEHLLLETAQLGGVLVFLEDDAPSSLPLWLTPLTEILIGDVPFVKRKASDIRSGKFKNQDHDLVVLFSSQKSLLEELGPDLNGQRLLLSSASEDNDSSLLDYIWRNCDLTQWTQALHKVRALWESAPALQGWPQSHETPCLFLDRDDVVVKNVPYNKDADLVELTPGIEHLLQRAHAQGYWVALVTNQSGLGRGRISWKEYQQVHQRMLQLLADKNCWIDESVWSGFYRPEGVSAGRRHADLRKPRCGMFQRVNSKLLVNLTRSVMVGDSASDLIAAFHAGVRNLYLLESEKTAAERSELTQFAQSHSGFLYQAIQNFSEVKI